MPITIVEAQDEDLPRLFTIACTAFEESEPATWRAFFPNHWTEAGRKAGAERYLKTKQSSPNATYHKALDADTGEILGFSVSTVYQNRLLEYPAKMPPSTYWDDEADAEYARSIADWFAKQRSEYVKSLNGNVVHLNTLAVLPSRQRQGIGRFLMARVLEKADDLGFDAFVESSIVGRGLYERSGFVLQKDVTIAVPEKFADREAWRYALLIRPPKN